MTTTMKLTTKDMMARLRANEDEAVEKLGGMQLVDTDLLLAAAEGKIDLNQVAALLVASRGIGRSGKWVGFPEAERQMDGLIKKLEERAAPRPSSEVFNKHGRAVKVTIPEAC